jgi:hypothetical protein
MKIVNSILSRATWGKVSCAKPLSGFIGGAIFRHCLALIGRGCLRVYDQHSRLLSVSVDKEPVRCV